MTTQEVSHKQRKAHAMATITQTTYHVNDRAFQAALAEMRTRALTAYPNEEARINRGHAIAAQGGVTLLNNGIASVASQTYPDTDYTVNGSCICRDYAVAPAGRCKHRYAASMHRKTLEYLMSHVDEPLEGQNPSTPSYAFPTLWTRFYATYSAPGLRVNGIAERQEDGSFLFTPEGETSSVPCQYDELALGPGITNEC